jgi:hypothetical protein
MEWMAASDLMTRSTPLHSRPTTERTAAERRPNPQPRTCIAGATTVSTYGADGSWVAMLDAGRTGRLIASPGPACTRLGRRRRA